MTKSLKYFGIAIVGILVFLTAFSFYFLSASTAQANPPSYKRAQTAATSTQSGYLTPGTGTTTLVADLGEGNNFGADGAILLLQLTGSTSPFISDAYASTTYRITLEFAHDPTSGINCKTTPTACDWYRDTTAVGTTTSQEYPTPTTYTIALGEDTLAGNPIATTTPTRRAIDVPTPMRYVRAVVTLPIKTSGTNGAVWLDIIAKKQNQ